MFLLFPVRSVTVRSERGSIGTAHAPRSCARTSPGYDVDDNTAWRGAIVIMGSVVLKSLSVLLGIFFIFVGTMKLTSFISKDLHKDLVCIIGVGCQSGGVSGGVRGGCQKSLRVLPCQWDDEKNNREINFKPFLSLYFVLTISF